MEDSVSNTAIPTERTLQHGRLSPFHPLAVIGACIQPAIARLMADQRSDGRIGISSDHPDAFWPTPLAILAWFRVPNYSQYQSSSYSISVRNNGPTLEKIFK